MTWLGRLMSPGDCVLGNTVPSTVLTGALHSAGPWGPALKHPRPRGLATEEADCWRFTLPAGHTEPQGLPLQREGAGG